MVDMDHLRYQHMNLFEKAMNWCEEKYKCMASPHQYISRKDNDDKFLVYERGDCVFVINLHPTNAYAVRSREVSPGVGLVSGRMVCC
jgi:1,4-alpha-glucan branching enzyme